MQKWSSAITASLRPSVSPLNSSVALACASRWSNASLFTTGRSISHDQAANTNSVRATGVDFVRVSRCAAEAFENKNYEDAIELWEAAINSRDQSEKSLSLINCLNSLACSYGELGNYRQKLQLLERSRQMVHSLYGPTHLQYGVVLFNIACAKEEVGLYAHMKDLLLESVDIHQRRFGASHVKASRILLRLSAAHAYLGEHEQQLHVAKRAFDILCRHHGHQHVHTTNAMLMLARAHGANGRPDLQLQLAQLVLDMYENKVGPMHPQLAPPLMEVAAAYKGNGDLLAQKAHLERAVQVQQRAVGAQLTNLVDTYTALADTCAALGDADAQAHYYDKAYKTACQQYQGKHVMIGAAAVKAALGCLSNGKDKMAQLLLTKASAILSECVSPDHPAAQELKRVSQLLKEKRDESTRE